MATVTIQEAARLLGVKPGKVRALIGARKLAARPISPLAGTRGRDDVVLDADEVETLARLRAHKRRTRGGEREPVNPIAATADSPRANAPGGVTQQQPVPHDDAPAAPVESARAIGPELVSSATGFGKDHADQGKPHKELYAAGAATYAAAGGTPVDAPHDHATAEDDARHDHATVEGDVVRRALSGDVEDSTALDLAGQRMVALVQSMLTPLVGELHDARETIRRQAEELGALRAAVADLERRVSLPIDDAAPRMVKPAPQSLDGPAAQSAHNGAAPAFDPSARQRPPALWRRALSHFIGG